MKHLSFKLILMSKPSTIIIGGGPGGASAAIYLAHYNMPVLLIDAPEKIHGRTKMAATLENFLSHTDRIDGPKFIQRIDAQLKLFPIERKNEKVIEVGQGKDEFLVKTEEGNEYHGKYIILAVGFRDIGLKIEGIDPYYDEGIYHCITCDWFQNRNKKIAVIGNTDGAIKLAREINLMLPPPKLIVTPDQAKPQYSKELLELAKKDKIEIFFSPLIEVIGDGKYIQKIKLADDTIIAIDVLFTTLGKVPRIKFLERGKIMVDIDDRGLIKVDWRTFETSVKNLFAVGPCNNGPDQAIIAAGQGAMAALHISSRIKKELGL
jgi:thioredoxin reductase (NADPH)